jgi:large subunit ribosomal protein L19
VLETYDDPISSPQWGNAMSQTSDTAQATQAAELTEAKKSQESTAARRLPPIINNKFELLRAVEQSCEKPEIPHFEVGDVVDVHTRILEGNKERIQIFSGTVIARSGSGTREMFTVRRIVAGEGVERKFPLHSPKIAKIEVKRSNVVRRAKLYYLRNRTGKGTRLKERRVAQQMQGEE